MKTVVTGGFRFHLYFSKYPYKKAPRKRTEGDIVWDDQINSEFKSKFANILEAAGIKDCCHKYKAAIVWKLR